MRMIKVPIESVEDFNLVMAHLERIGFIGVEALYMPHTGHFGFMVLRNKQYITGNLERAVHNPDEDLPVSAGRFLKLTEVQVKCILDVDNFVDE